MQQRYYIPLTVALLLLATYARAQQDLVSITEGPVYNIACDSNCATYHLNQPRPRVTDTYAVSTITYAPQAITGTTVSLADDHFSTALPIGFRFCFYQAQYTQMYVSDNGHITFNSLYSGQPASFDTETPLPFYNSSFPDAAIYAPFMDHKPSAGGTIKYQMLGAAPFRRMVVQWSAMELFGATCTGGTSTYQVILYETTNIIEAHITQKAVCDADPNNYRNYATLGLQALGAADYDVAPGRNATVWTAANEGWRFSPAGAPAWTTTWFLLSQGQLANSNKDTMRICAPGYPQEIRVRLTLQCPDTVVWDTVTVIKPEPHIDSIVIDTPLCLNSTNGVITIYASGPGGPFQYSAAGQPFQSSNVVTGIPAGSIVIKVKGTVGCTWDSTILLPPLSDLEAVIDSFFTPTCPDSNGIIWAHGEGGVAPYTYLWSTADADSVLNDVPGNVTYTVTVTDALGCESAAFIALEDLGLPLLSSSMVKPVCDSATGSITIHANSVHGGPYQYQWLPNVTTDSTANNILPGLYFVYVTDGAGCKDAIAVVLYDTLDVLATRDTIPSQCGLANGQGTMHPSGSISPYTYAWSNGQTTQTATGLEGGQTYSVITKAANGCKRTDYFYIKPSLALDLSLFPANAHCDSINGVVSTLVLNDSGGVYYQWSTGAVTPSIEQLAPGYYALTVTDGRGCTDTGSAIIGDDGTPYLSILSYQPPLCFGDSTGSVTLGGISGVAPYKYSLDGLAFSTTAQINNIPGGTYTIYIRDANSCPNDTVVTFTQPDRIVANITGLDTLICYADKLELIAVSASGGFPAYTYAIDGGAFGSTPGFSGTGIGQHTIAVRDSRDCEEMFEAYVPGPGAPLALSLAAQDNPCFYDSSGVIMASATGGWAGYTYAWSTDGAASGPMLDSLAAGEYTLTVADARGCATTTTDTIVQNLCCLARIANAFTPDGDLTNDVLHVLPISEVSALDYRIFNRYGEEMFRTTDLAKGWDGRYNGQPMPIGTYFYLVQYQCPFSSEKKMLKGDVTLIR